MLSDERFSSSPAFCPRAQHRRHWKIERALDRMPKGTKGGKELAELMEKAQSVYKTIAEIQQRLTQITQALSQEEELHLLSAYGLREQHT